MPKKPADEFAAALEPWPVTIEYAGTLQALAGRIMLNVEQAETAADEALAGTVALLRGLGADESEIRTTVAAIASRLHQSLDEAYRNALSGQVE
jgi:hypothetical protein